MDDLSDELEATLAARRELGDHYERDLVRSFVDKVERAVDARLRETTPPPVAERLEARPGPRPLGDVVVPLFSLAIGIPISAIIGGLLHGFDALVGLVVAWSGIAIVNIAHAVGRRRAT